MAEYTADSVAFADVKAKYDLMVDGDILNIPAGSAVWSSQLSVSKIIQIIGAGMNDTVITGSGRLFKLTGTNSISHPSPFLLRLSSLTLNAITGSSVEPLTMDGVSVIHEVGALLTGGFRVDHVMFNGAITAKKSVNIGGWQEGVFDHCIWDTDLTISAGEHIIINHTTSPDGTGGYGDYAWSIPYDPESPHQVVFEDCIMKHSPGGTDTDQYAAALSGGGMYIARHCTSWGQLGGGHGCRETGAVRGTGQRAGQSYKNLHIRQISAPAQSSAFNAIRAGESLCWGNRHIRNGQTVQADIAPHAIRYFGYCAGEWNTNNFGPADGTNPFDENEKGTITNFDTHGDEGNPTYIHTYNVDSSYSNGSVVNGVDSDPTKGDVYAHGVGGSNCKGTACAYNPVGFNSYEYIIPTGLDFHGVADYWRGFVIRNLNIPLENLDPISWAYIRGSDPISGQLYVDGANDHKNSAIHHVMKLGPSDPWEIRKVKKYWNVPGSGYMDTSLDSTQIDPPLLVSGSPNPRWTNEVDAGLWQWDNKYTITDGPPWTDDLEPYNTTDGSYALIIRSAHNEPKPGYTYDDSVPAGSAGPPEVRRDTRVGADAEVWALVPASWASGTGANSLDGTDSLYEDGAGGYTYPHPFVESTLLGKIILITGDTDFGSVLVGETAQRTITVTNGGDQLLTIASITYPSRYTGFTGGFSLDPGESQEIVVTFSPNAVGTFNGNMVFDSDADSGTETKALTGFGIQILIEQPMGSLC